MYHNQARFAGFLHRALVLVPPHSIMLAAHRMLFCQLTETCFPWRNSQDGLCPPGSQSG